MIALLLLAAAAPLAGDAARYETCLALSRSAPERAIETAQAWRIEGGGVAARHCLALAQYARKDYAAALVQFEGAAQDSLRAGDGKAALLWTQAADVALLAGQPEPAVRYLANAIALADNPARAVLLVDRAAALVDLKREAEAAQDLDAAVKLDPAVPDGWLLKATLARRTGDLAAAEAAILEAAKQAPDTAEVQYEAGNIAAARDKTELARAAWTAAEAADPDSIAGKAAAAALARLATAAIPAN